MHAQLKYINHLASTSIFGVVSWSTSHTMIFGNIAGDVNIYSKYSYALNKWKQN